MGIMTAAVATTIGSAANLAPIPASPIDLAPLIVLPSETMPSLGIYITQLAYNDHAEHVWHDVSWDALAESTEELYAL
jgi:hypothetical protein